MFGDLHLLLAKAKRNKEMLEITSIKKLEGLDGFTFIGMSKGIDEGSEELGWSFINVNGANKYYYCLPFEDIATVRRVGDTEYAYHAGQKSVIESSLSMAI